MRWFDLYEAIKAGGHKLMRLDRRPRLGQRRRQHARARRRPTCPTASTRPRSAAWRSCWPTATLMRTGMGAMAGNKAWHCYKRGLGPTPDQMFMQSNFGIVTKMGYWLMPEPEVYMPLWLRLPKDDDIAPADRHAAHAHARRDDPHGPADHEHAAARPPCSPSPQASGTTGHGRCPRRRSSRWRGAGHRPLDRCASRSTGTRRSSTTASRRSRTRSRPRSRARRSGARSTTPDRHRRTSSTRAERVQGGVPSLDLNT